MAVKNTSEEMALVLLNSNEVHFDTNDGIPYIYTACKKGWVNLVRALVKKHGTSILKDDSNTPADKSNRLFEMAVNHNKEEMAMAMMNEFHCDTKEGTPYINKACRRGWVNLVRALVQKHGTDILKKIDVTPGVNEGNTPLHVAAMSGREDVVLSLINEFGCDVNVTGHLGRSLLHSASVSDNGSLVRLVNQHISLGWWMTMVTLLCTYVQT